MMPLVLLAILSPLVVGLGAWHFTGYFNGRYARWAQEAQS